MFDYQYAQGLGEKRQQVKWICGARVVGNDELGGQPADGPAKKRPCLAGIEHKDK